LKPSHCNIKRFSFLGQIDRILSETYVPSDNDAIQCTVPLSSSIKAAFKLGLLRLRFRYPNSASMASGLANEYLTDSLHFGIYVFDLDTYNHIDYNGETRLYNTILEFQRAAKIPWFPITGTIIIFNNLDKFRRKLLTVPFGQFFPGYTAGNGPTDAYDWILLKIKDCNYRKSQPILHFSTEGVCSKDNLETIRHWIEIIVL
jgi:hypothetical protein